MPDLTESYSRLVEAPVPAAELHAERLLHRIEVLAEDGTKDPFRVAA